MESSLMKHLDLLISRYPKLVNCQDTIIEAFKLICSSYENDGKLLVAGNGGSAADSEHIAGELMKRFKIPRPITASLAKRLIEIDEVRGSQLSSNLESPLTVIPLTGHEALSTAYINDVSAHSMFAQQLLGYGRAGDVFLGISTSGNSENILNAAILAKALDIKVIGLTGERGGELSRIADVTVRAPEKDTFLVQELHLPIYHCWCLMLEEYFFGGGCRKHIYENYYNGRRTGEKSK